MINKWQKIVLKDIYDRRQIPFGVLEKFEALTHESPIDEYEEIFVKLGFDWKEVLDYIDEVEEYEQREFIHDYFKKQLPLKQSILEIKKSLLDFEVWNHLMYMFDHHHDSLKHREEVFLKYLHESESEWKYQKLSRLEERRPQLIARQKARRHELELKELNNIELSPKEKKEIKYYKDYDQFQIDHKNNVLSDMLRVSGGDVELGFAGINFDADFEQFNRPEFIEEVKEMKADAAKKIQENENETRDKIFAIKQAKNELERKLRDEYSELERNKDEELSELEDKRQQNIQELQDEARERIEDEIRHKEAEMLNLVNQFETEKTSILEEFEEGITDKLNEIDLLNTDIANEQKIQEEIKKQNEEEITRLKAEWELIQNKNVIADLEKATKRELILLAQSLQITVPSIDTQKSLRRKIMERVDQLQLRYNDSDLEEMIEARILELETANKNIDENAEGEENSDNASGDAFGGGGDAFGGGGDAFGGGGDAFGGGDDAFGGGGDAFGGGGDSAPASANKKGKKEPKPDKYADYPLPEEWDEYTAKDKKMWIKEYEKSMKLHAKESQSRKAKAAMEAEIQRQVEERLTQELEIRAKEFEERVEHIENVDAKSINTKAAGAEDKLKSIISKLDVLHNKDEELEKIHNHEWTGEEEDDKPSERQLNPGFTDEESEETNDSSNDKKSKKKKKKEKKSKKEKNSNESEDKVESDSTED